MQKKTYNSPSIWASIHALGSIYFLFFINCWYIYNLYVYDMSFVFEKWLTIWMLASWTSCWCVVIVDILICIYLFIYLDTPHTTQNIYNTRNSSSSIRNGFVDGLVRLHSTGGSGIALMFITLFVLLAFGCFFYCSVFWLPLTVPPCVCVCVCGMRKGQREREWDSDKERKREGATTVIQGRRVEREQGVVL